LLLLLLLAGPALAPPLDVALFALVVLPAELLLAPGLALPLSALVLLDESELSCSGQAEETAAGPPSPRAPVAARTPMISSGRWCRDFRCRGSLMSRPIRLLTDGAGWTNTRNAFNWHRMDWSRSVAESSAHLKNQVVGATRLT
jgi:hypothetical protein